MSDWKLLILTVSLLALPNLCWGADVLYNFNGFESQSTLDAQISNGSPSFDTSTQLTGTSSLQLAGSATQASIAYAQGFDSGGVRVANEIGKYYMTGVHFKTTDITPSSQTTFFAMTRSQQSPNIQLALEADGDLVVGNSAGTTIATITTPFSINTWYFIELGFQQTSTGSCELYIDGVDQSISCTSQDLDNGDDQRYVKFYGPGSGDGTYYFDNFYVLVDNADTAIPTPLAASSDGLEVFAYQNGLASQTPDTGYTALDSATNANNWDTSADLPWSTTAGATYTGTPLNGGVVFNDAATNGHGPGPSGGAYTIDGTIKGGKWSWLMDRGTGGATTHTAYYGSSGDTPLTSFTFTDPDADVLRAIVLESALVPTTSETFAMGMGLVGAQDLECDQMMAEIIHLPPAAAQTYPAVYYVTKNEEK